MRPRNKKLYNLVVAALFAAAITVTTAYILHIPIPMTSGYVHLGDALIYLCAALLPAPYAMAAAAVGGAVADLLTAPMWAAGTFVIKAIICLPFTQKKEKILCTRNVVAVGMVGVISPVLYSFYNVFLVGSWAAFWPQFVGTLVQAVGSGVVFLVLAYGADKVRLKDRLTASLH